MMKIYPEMMRDKIWFEFSEKLNKESKLSILDDTGCTIILKRIDKAEKGDTFMLDLTELLPGSYQLVLEVGNIRQLHKIIVD